jgi:hypothetical protein
MGMVTRRHDFGGTVTLFDEYHAFLLKKSGHHTHGQKNLTYPPTTLPNYLRTTIEGPR